MDGNLENLMVSTGSDRADPSGMRSDVSELTRNDSIEDSETTSTGIQTTWTEEKHRLYISSMEASFVKQLHNLERRSLNMVDWRSRGTDKLNLGSSRQLNDSTRASSGQFKVLRGGCWESIKYEKAQPQIAGETHGLPQNIWIKHFRSGRKNQDVRTPSLQQNGIDCTGVCRSGEKKAESRGVANSSKRNYESDVYREDSVGSNTEVSGQNFGNEDLEGQQFSRAKRMKTEACVESDNDQVVPMGKAPMTFDLNEKYTSPDEEAGTKSGERLEVMDDFACLQPGSSYYTERELREGDCHAKELMLMEMRSS